MSATASDALFEVKATDLAGRISTLKTKTSSFETPALLPVIHPVRQIVPCPEIRSMGYEAVMTNAFTTYRRLFERADEGIHKIIGFEGSIMTDSGGYQVLEYGSVDITPEAMAHFEERIGSDIAIVLDKPTGLNVTKAFSRKTVEQTLEAARKTTSVISRRDMIWTLPIQGGAYVDLVSKSAKASGRLKDFGCYALGSPVEVMEDYDFPLLVRMILASKRFLPTEKPFHLFGAGHPLIIPLAISLGCDMFDSASYILYAKQDRYISSSGTVRLENLEYLACTCRVCSSMNAKEMKSLPREQRILAIARHNLYFLKKVIDESKQAIWEGRLWEYVRANSLNHPKAFEAFKLATSESSGSFETGTPRFKERGIFISDSLDLARPEVTRFRSHLKELELRGKNKLIIVPETKKKPFLVSDFFQEISRIVNLEDTLVACIVPGYGLVPAEISDIFPLSQTTIVSDDESLYPSNDPIISSKHWDYIFALSTPKHWRESKWLRDELKLRNQQKKSVVSTSKSYSEFKKRIATQRS